MHIVEHKFYERRIKNFVDTLSELFYENEEDISISYAKFDSLTVFGEHTKAQYQAINSGEEWGQNWQNVWFKLEGKMPSGFREREVVLHVDLGGEGCLYSNSGAALDAFSCHSVFAPTYFRDRYIIDKQTLADGKFTYWIDGSASWIFGGQVPKNPNLNDPLRFGDYRAKFNYAKLAIFRTDIWQLHLDLVILSELMFDLPEKSVRRSRIRYQINEAIHSFNSSAKQVEVTRQKLQALLKDTNSPSSLTTVAIGHAHIDTAWLWPYREGIKKCARTFSAQLNLLEQYPSYRFGASQAQHFAFVKKHYPELYERVKEKVTEKKFEIQGAMWVEADCNLISGESLVRQLIHGKKFFADEFGINVRNLWLPDVFGYSAALPQILSLAEVDYMVTQKLSWNRYNKFPYHSFVWRGIDGSEVITHFPPEDQYDSELAPVNLRYAENNFNEKHILDEYLTLFGVGDGGGGPKAEVIEKGLRQANLEGVPRVKFEFAQNFLDRLGTKKSVLPEWIGELYLELHSGTLTSQAAIKRANRKAELGLREIEILYSNLSLEDYPQAQLDYLWKKLLLNQFHDIIPGSSINCVYKDAHSDYLEIFEGLATLKQKFCAKMPQKQNSVTLFNSLSVTTNSLIELQDSLNEYTLSYNGVVLEKQTIANKNYIQLELAPFSSQILQLCKSEKEPDIISTQEENNLVLSNELITYHFNSQGQLIRIYDKEASRDVMRTGEIGNCLSLYHDLPADFEAWDIDLCYEQQLLETAKLIKNRYENGALAQVVYCSYSIGESSLIEQQIILPHNSKELQFITQVKWQERRKMLRVAFAVDVQAPTASYEIQYGIVERPTHRNTSWQMAQYEVVGHRFADLSDKQYGVALLNDCKYGYKIHGNSIDLNLLRSPMYPDAEADLGNHEFCYSLLPHQESLAFSNVLPQALALNQPPVILSDIVADLKVPLVFDNKKVIIEVCKRSESENAWIVRAYEPLGLRQATVWKLSSEYKISEVNLMERNDREVDAIITFRPFEIKTFKLSL